MAERHQRADKKRINTDQVVSYLNHAFAKAQQKAFPALGSKNQKGTVLYDYQCDFCHLINDIERGPLYIVPKLITEANELIERLANEK